MNDSDLQFQDIKNSDKTVISMQSNLFKPTEINKFTLEAFSSQGLARLGQIFVERGQGNFPVKEGMNWFENGLDCEILSTNSQGWQKGKVRFKVTLEFCPGKPEIPESELDALR